MPYSVRKQGNKWAIIKDDTGEVVGHSDSESMAKKSIAARYANEGSRKVDYKFHK